MNLDEVFKFKIGDCCAMKAAVESFGWEGTQSLAVNERHLQECEGGVQLSYYVRVIGRKESGWSRGAEQSFAGHTASGFYLIKESELIHFDSEAYRQANDTPASKLKSALKDLEKKDT